MENPQIYSLFDKNLNRLSDASGVQSLEVDPSNITSGSLLGILGQGIGNLSAGKLEFTNDDAGYILGLDKGVAKFYIGDDTSYINWDGTSLSIAGSFNIVSDLFTIEVINGSNYSAVGINNTSIILDSTGTINIGGETSASTVGAEINFTVIGGNAYEFWSGASNKYGIFDFSSISSSSKTFTFPNASGTIALQGLAGTKVYYVSDSSGGAVTRKLTFTNGILTSET